MVAKAASISPSLLACRTCNSSPSVRAAASSSLVIVSARAVLAGLTSSATMVAVGTNSCSSSSRFAATSTFKVTTPVRLPPGRLRLVTRPSWTGSAAAKNTIGIVVVAVRAASTAGVLVEKMTVTGRRTNAPASAGKRSFRPSVSVCLYQARSVTNEPARHYELTKRVHGRNRMACCECNELLDPAVEKSIVTDEQRPGSCLDQAHEGGVDFAVGARFQYLDLYPDGKSCRLHVSRPSLRYGI